MRHTHVTIYPFASKFFSSHNMYIFVCYILYIYDINICVYIRLLLVVVYWLCLNLAIALGSNRKCIRIRKYNSTFLFVMLLLCWWLYVCVCAVKGVNKI